MGSTRSRILPIRHFQLFNPDQRRCFPKNSFSLSSLILFEVDSLVLLFLNCGVSDSQWINCSCTCPVPVICKWVAFGMCEAISLKNFAWFVFVWLLEFFSLEFGAVSSPFMFAKIAKVSASESLLPTTTAWWLSIQTPNFF